MLNYHLHKQKGQPLYVSLYACIKQDIVTGRLPAGTRLPSKRDMASCHGISVRTVLNAYEQLLAEGYIESLEKRGYYVSRVYEDHAQPQNLLHSSQAPESDLLVDFSSVHLVYDRFPYTTWKRVLREVLTDYDTQLIERSDPCGIPVLREAIAGYLGRARGIDVSPDQIIVGSGVESIYSRLVRILPPAAIYAAETPGYRKILWTYEDCHVPWHGIGMDEEGIRMADLEACYANVVHVSPDHHYPLGTTMSANRRAALLAWEGERPDRYIIEDDYDCEFRYHSQINPTLLSRDVHHRVIYTNTFGKTLAPGIRVSYMVLPERLMVRFRSSAGRFACPVSNLEQYALARFLNEGYYERHLRRMKRTCEQSGQRLIELLRSTPGLPIRDITGGETGTHLLVWLDTSLTDVQIRWAARQHGIGLTCLAEYCSDDNESERERYRSTLVLNYSNVDPEVLEEAVHRLADIFS